jgi:thiol-disulfide isomerase/thioredoxin
MIVLWGVAALSATWSGGTARAQVSDAKTSPPGTPTAETILRKTADYFKAARSVAFEVERVQRIGDHTIRTTTTVAFQRPNRFAVRAGEGIPGVTVVSDGKTMFTFIPALHKYTETEAPASLDGLARDPLVVAALQGLMIGELGASDPYAKLMEGVKTARYAGQEALDGAQVHHLLFTQDQFDWELWVAADGDPTIRRVHVDLSKARVQAPGLEALKNLKMEMSQDYKGWRIDRDLDDKAFVFQPPKDAQKVASFFEGMPGGGQEAPSPLLGEMAPDVNLKLLDKGEFRLKEHRDQRLVVLDFWATWCGPCVQELPLLAEVARGYKDKGVVFCAVNLKEKPEKINQFLEEKKLALTVALDPEGTVGDAYHAEAIPMLVLIDKKGVVQSVHVGYDPAIKATLQKELDDLLAGKDLAREALARAKRATLSPESEGLEQAWSVNGPYTSAATDAKGQAIFAVQRQGHCDVLDLDGKTIRTFRLTGNNHTIVRFTRLAGNAGGATRVQPMGTVGPVLQGRRDQALGGIRR